MAKRAARTCESIWKRRRDLAAVALLTIVAGALVSGDALARAAATRSSSGPAVGSEIASLRTAGSRTFVGRDGTRVAHVFGEPVNFKTATGHWKKIDNRLVPDG